MQPLEGQPHVSCIHRHSSLVLASFLEHCLPIRAAATGCAGFPRGSVPPWIEKTRCREQLQGSFCKSKTSHGSCSLQLLQPAAARSMEQKVESLFSISLANRVLKTFFFLTFLWFCTEGDDLQICPSMLESNSLFPQCSALCICQVIPGCNSFKTKGFVWCLFFNDWTVD